MKDCTTCGHRRGFLLSKIGIKYLKLHFGFNTTLPIYFYKCNSANVDGKSMCSFAQVFSGAKTECGCGIYGKKVLRQNKLKQPKLWRVLLGDSHLQSDSSVWGAETTATLWGFSNVITNLRSDFHRGVPGNGPSIHTSVPGTSACGGSAITGGDPLLYVRRDGGGLK